MGYTAGQTLRASQLGPVPCTSTTRPASPHSGQLIVESDTGMVAIYSGSAWRYLCPTGEVSTHGEYNPSGAQSIPNNSSTKLAFANESISTPLVTKTVSGVGHDFTLNRSGIWSVSVSMRMSSATGERHLSVADSAGDIAASNVIFAGVAQLNVALTRYFGSGSVINFLMYQSTGGALNTTGLFGQSRVHIAWLHS